MALPLMLVSVSMAKPSCKLISHNYEFSMWAHQQSYKLYAIAQPIVSQLQTQGLFTPQNG